MLILGVADPYKIDYEYAPEATGVGALNSISEVVHDVHNHGKDQLKQQILSEEVNDNESSGVSLFEFGHEVVEVDHSDAVVEHAESDVRR